MRNPFKDWERLKPLEPIAEIPTLACEHLCIRCGNVYGHLPIVACHEVPMCEECEAKSQQADAALLANYNFWTDWN